MEEDCPIVVALKAEGQCVDFKSHLLPWKGRYLRQKREILAGCEGHFKWEGAKGNKTPMYPTRSRGA